MLVSSIRRASSILVGALALLSALLASPALGAKADKSPSDPGSKVVPNHYIVVLRDSTNHPGRVAERHAQNRDARIGHVYSHALKGYAAEIPPDELSAVRQDPNVVSVEPDVRGGVASQETPTGIDRIFATANESLAINSYRDYDVDVNVAVLDMAVEAEHPDLNVVGQVNCYGEEPPVCVEEESIGGYHATHVAGTIGAIDNDFGVVGVAPGARLWSVKVLNNSGFGDLSEYIAGIDWVTSTREDEDPENDIEVANSSLRYWNETSSAAFEKAIEASLEAGVVHVVAAGNETETVKYIPGNYPGVITVSALADYDGKPGGKRNLCGSATANISPTPKQNTTVMTTLSRASATTGRSWMSPPRASASTRP